MIFSLILVIKNVLGVEPEMILNLLNPYTILGFICGGSVIYWFTGASMQAVSAGAYKAVEYIKKNIQLDENRRFEGFHRKIKGSCKDLYAICTKRYAEYLYCNLHIHSGICIPSQRRQKVKSLLHSSYHT